ncbi:MAG TPA: hypothetical protein VGR35_07880 [Tepidisphaeraceae bacterium]|nr:hypothetical protein [Tepidisphaeraceae bacterium]
MYQIRSGHDVERIADAGRLADDRRPSGLLTRNISRARLNAVETIGPTRRGGSIMTVESFGVETVQAVATVLLAALVLLGAVLLAVVAVVEGAQGLVTITLPCAAARPSTRLDNIRPPRRRSPASLPSRGPPGARMKSQG